MNSIKQLLSSYRTIYPNRMLDDTNVEHWSNEEIYDVLDSPKYSHIKWRFFRYEGSGNYQKMIRSVPITTVFDQMNTMVRPIYADFTEMTENKEFIKVAGFLYYQLFINEIIYVSYNFFENPNDYILEPNTPEKIKKTIEEIKDRGGFDVWIKLTENELDGDRQFMHVETSITVKIPKWRKKLAQVKWSAVYCGNFNNWLTVSIIYLTLTKFLEDTIKLAGKRVFITTNTNTGDLIKRIEAMLNSFDNSLHLNLQDMVNIKNVEYIDGSLLDSIKNAIFLHLDRMMYEFGRVTNTNPKGERMTTAENFKDLSGIANRQKETLEYLISFAYQAKDLWNIDLEFAISGIPEKEALPIYSHYAQTPNSDMNDFVGQVEGTAPRVPTGLKTSLR